MQLKISKIPLFLLFASLGFQSILGQISRTDSMIIRHLNAIKITDSVESPIPTPIRKLTLDFLIRNGNDPSGFYTFKLSPISVYEESHVFFYYKIGALREIYDLEQEGRIIIGSPGEPGDAIFITYDLSYSNVMHIFGEE